MDKKLILAVAGSGKTYHICNVFNPEKRNMIIAYTNENIHNIRNEILARFGTIPGNTRICTFHKFVYSFFIRPNEIYISEHFRCGPFKSSGICLEEPPPVTIGGKYNPRYVKKDFVRHYYTKDLAQIYCARMSELPNTLDCVFEKGIERINKFLDAIYIDEFQDFREFNFRLLEKVIKKAMVNILLVGDYYQHSVSGDNNSGCPFSGKDGDFDGFIKQMKSDKLTIDQTTLLKSRRCSSSVCDFVSSKLNIPIQSCSQEKGDVIEIRTVEEANAVLNDPSIKKLVISDARKYGKDYMNWGYSKGDTFPKTCVILTEDTSKICSNSFSPTSLKQQTINKLYVALTRSKGDVFILPRKIFVEVTIRG